MFKVLKNTFCVIKKKCPDIVLHSVIIFVFSQLGAVINFVTNLLIVPKYLDANDLGLIAPVTQFVAFGAIPLAVITNLVIKYVTKYEANEEWGKLKSLVRDLVIFGIVTTVLISAFFLITSSSFALRAKIDSKVIIFWMLIYLCVSSWLPLVNVLTRAAQRFYVIAIMGFLSPLALMICSLILLPNKGFAGYLIALIVSVGVNVVVSAYAVYKYLCPYKNEYEPYMLDVKPLLKKYAVVLVLGSVIGWLWAFIPSFTVRNFLSRADSAGFFFVQRLSMLPFYAFSSVMLILMPILSMKHEKKESTARTVKGTILYTLFSGMIVTALLYLFSPLLFKYVPQWREYSDYSQYIWMMSISVTLAAINYILSTNFFAKWMFKPYRYTLPFSLFFVVLIYVLFGWGIMKPYLPINIWQYINNIPKNISLIILLMVINNVVNMIINMIWYAIINKNKDKYMKKDFI
jgi:O-antigen/teichoic acid export membrane protein